MENIKKRLPMILGMIIILLVIIIAIVLVYKAKNKLEQYTIKNEKVYTFLGDDRIDFDSEITLDNKNSITKIYLGEKAKDYELETTPIYYANEDKIILPYDMSVISYSLGFQQNKINHYSTVYKNQIDTEVNFNNKKYTITNSFLYDGDNLYFFTTDVKVKFGKTTIDLPAFSFISCYYNSDLYIYNYETKEIKYYEIKDNVNVYSSIFEINVSVDRAKVNDDIILLSKNISTLPNLK